MLKRSEWSLIWRSGLYRTPFQQLRKHRAPPPGRFSCPACWGYTLRDSFPNIPYAYTATTVNLSYAASGFWHFTVSCPNKNLSLVGAGRVLDYSTTRLDFAIARWCLYSNKLNRACSTQLNARNKCSTSTRWAIRWSNHDFKPPCYMEISIQIVIFASGKAMSITVLVTVNTLLTFTFCHKCSYMTNIMWHT